MSLVRALRKQDGKILLSAAVTAISGCEVLTEYYGATLGSRDGESIVA
jgi:hypothetical protein